MKFVKLFLYLAFVGFAAAYGFINGVQNWNGTCLTGVRQSPIDVKHEQVRFGIAPIDVRFNYTVQIVKSILLTDTYEVEGDFGTLILKESAFKFRQFHFHAPSEHTFQGQHYDLEMHLVHKHTNGSGDFAVVSVFFQGKGAHNHFIQKIIDAKRMMVLDLMELLIDKHFMDFYYYEGSFTTVPCNEITTWLLWSKIQSISDKQLEFFNKLWDENPNYANGKGNNRDPQDLHGREITFSGDYADAAKLAGVMISLAAASFF